MLVGGKRKRGSKASRRKKKSKKRNNNCRGGTRTYHTSLGNGEERRECLKRVALEEMKSRVCKLPHPNPEVDEYKEGFYLLVRKPEVVDSNNYYYGILWSWFKTLTPGHGLRPIQHQSGDGSSPNSSNTGRSK